MLYKRVYKIKAIFSGVHKFLGTDGEWHVNETLAWEFKTKKQALAFWQNKGLIHLIRLPMMRLPVPMLYGPKGGVWSLLDGTRIKGL
jgi:hypothetical protein